MTVASKIACYVVDSSHEKMPSHALTIAKIAVLDTLGVALAGAKEESVRIAAAIVREEGGREEASLIGQGARASAQQAALVNGTASHAADFDHSFVLAGQPTAPVVPAAFAMGEALGASGRQVLDAYITGFEVTAKLAFAALGVPGAGFHADNSLGGFGATAACAKLLGLDAGQTEMALAITASMASGLSANFGTMSKPLHVGLAARNGVLACQLAAKGFTANSEAFEARNGFFEAFYRAPSTDSVQAKFNEAAIDELGVSYELEKSGIRLKPYPCGGLTHAAIYATIALRDEHGLVADMIEKIDVDVPRGTYQTIAFRVPEDALQGKFCMGYLIARALIDGKVTLDTFTETAIRDPDVLDLLHRVEMRADPSLESGRDGSRPATVTVHLRDGATHSLHSRFPKGGSEVPMSNEELQAKFADCARNVLSDSDRDRALEMIRGIETLDNVRPLMDLLRGTVSR
jgi:2-methylcitrate dehydratase PrpD